MLIAALLALTLDARADLAGPCGCGGNGGYKPPYDSDTGIDSGDQASLRRLAHELPTGAQAGLVLGGLAMLLAAGRRRPDGA